MTSVADAPLSQTVTVDETSYMRYFVDDGAMVGI